VPPAVASTEAPERDGSKRLFVNRARGFAKRASEMALPVFPAAAGAAILVATAAGAFGTYALAPLPRLGFWTVLIGFNTALWICWFAWSVRSSSDWWRAAAIGAILLNLPLPFEISLVLRLFGGSEPRQIGTTWFHAAAVSAAILAVVAAAVIALRRTRPRPNPKGRLWRAGFREPASIAAISAEDHYCRVSLADGTSHLVHARFADLVAEVASLDGAIVRRGQWVASSAVRSIDRAGRRWMIALSDGRSFPIAPSCLGELRARGWLARGGGPAP
jgi:hypothetical protein